MKTKQKATVRGKRRNVASHAATQTPESQPKAEAPTSRALDDKAQAKAVKAAAAILRKREATGGKVKCLTCAELDAVTTAAGLKADAQRAIVRRALREAGLHPAEGATGDGRLLDVKALDKAGR